jgi:hypothetical protein
VSHPLEIIGLVGGNPQDPVLDQRRTNRVQEIRSDKATPLMPSLRPRVGKQKMKDFHGLFGQQIPDSVGGFRAQDTHVVEPRRFSSRTAHATKQAFDSEKIFFVHSRSYLDEERTFATAKIDLQRRSAPEDSLQVEPVDVRLRDQFDHGEQIAPAAKRFNLARRARL